LINYFTNKTTEEKKFSGTKKLLIDCDKYGVSSEAKPLKLIFKQNLIEYLKTSSDLLYNFIDFYDANFSIIESYANSDKLYGFYKYIEEFIIEGKTINNNDHLMEVKNYIQSNLDLKDIFYLFVFMSLANDYNHSINFNPIIIFIDNLDYIDDFNELKKFTRAIDDFTVDMSETFSLFKLSAESNVRFGYIDKIKIIIAMRETTRASLPKSHFSDAFNTIYETHDVTEWYNKAEVVGKRLEFLENSTCLSGAKTDEMKLIKSIISDSHTKNILFPLFNNNYGSAISAITKIVAENSDIFTEYNEIISTPDSSIKYGARGILLKFIFDNLCTKTDGTESCFRKIGVLDLQDRKSNEVSISRIILAYFSNYTETRCDNARNCISFQQILNAFKGIFSPDDIIKYIWNMHELKDSIWTHLISFSQLEKKKYNGYSSFNEIDFEQTTLHYSCAGKIYIENISTHFEFFSTRIFKKKYGSLFCKANSEKNSENEYIFIEIIKGVLQEVKGCCVSLKKFNEKICRELSYPDPYQTQSKKYFDSPYVCQYKKLDGRRSKEYHEDRIINSHIGYIDKFRIYLLNYTDINETEKKDINLKLLRILKDYVDLFNIALVNDYTRNTLIPYYSEQLKNAFNNPMNNKLEINKPDD
jgi:hypothetical protein